MQPRIQYATTEDGTRIAFCASGSGPPLVVMPPMPFSHLQLEWDLPQFRSWLEALSQERLVVRYDARCTGLSQRYPLDFSMEASVRDLEAVVDSLGLGVIALFAPVNAGPVGVSFAVQHPERVSQLILWCTYSRGTDFFDAPANKALRTMIDNDWRLFTETAAHDRLGWGDGEAAERFAALIREAIEPDGQKQLMDVRRQVDVRALLAKIRCPTLVLHRQDTPWLKIDVATYLASQIKDAQLFLLEGAALAPYLGDSDGVLAVIEEFLAGQRQPETRDFHSYVQNTDISAPAGLTPREVEVLRLVANGRTNTEIAAELMLSVRTVARHITNIYTKIGARNRAEATGYAGRHRLT